jgi:hypothetical protein
MLLAKMDVEVSDSESILSFQEQGGDNWKVWDRFLAVDGKRAFHIGNICGTCSFFFERLEGANRSIDPQGLVEKLNTGFQDLDSIFVDQLKLIMPDGKYIVFLLEVLPKIVEPGDKNDYFSHEEIDLWGVDGFWGRPHSPKTEYYRLTTQQLSNHRGLFEFLVPTFPHTWLNTKRVDEYREMLTNNAKLTAIALSVLDIKQPADWEGEPQVNNHWCLAHYLVDGHHKTYTAATLGKPITLISFLAIEKGISSLENIEELLMVL